jgi:hypothetical protein
MFLYDINPHIVFMIQKQISLPEKLHQQIKQRAKLLQEPEEQVIQGPADLTQKHDIA